MDNWVERAQSAEARLSTAEAGTEILKQKLRSITETLGVKITAEGMTVDYDLLIQGLGEGGVAELREIMDAKSE